MKYWFVLILLAGSAGTWYAVNKHQKAALSAISSTAQEDVDLVPPDLAVDKQTPRLIPLDQTASDTVSDQEAPTVQNVTQVDEKVDIVFEEKSVAALESNIATLKTKVHVERENNGWRIYFTDPNNGLRQLGFRDGDFIDRNVLLNAYKDAQRTQLAHRFEKILDQMAI